MKYILALLITISFVLGQAWTGRDYTKITKECYICGKTISRYVEVSDSYFGISGFGGGPPNWQIADSSRTVHFNVNTAIDICPECDGKYTEEIREAINELWDKKLNRLIKRNNDKRIFYIEQRRLNKIKSLNKKIDELNKKRQELK